MSEPIVYIDRSAILEGKFEELKPAIDDLVALIESEEPGLIAYNVYLNEEATEMTVIHVHPDSASLERHMKVAGPAFPKLVGLISLLTIEVFGKPSDVLLDLLFQKARLLGDGTVVVHEPLAGFARFGLR